jgi:hypothetical protein
VDAGQLQPKPDPDIARSDCPVPHLGRRCRVLPVNVSSDSVRDFRYLAVLPANRAPPEASILRTWRCPCCNIQRERAGPIRLSRKAYADRCVVPGQGGSRHPTNARNRYTGAIGMTSHFQWETGGLEANLGKPITSHLPHRYRPPAPDTAAPDHRMATPLLRVPFGLVESPAPAGRDRGRAWRNRGPSRSSW